MKTVLFLNSILSNYTLTLALNQLKLMLRSIKSKPMKTKRSMPAPFFFCIIGILFLLDLAAFSVFEQQWMYSLLCFYILQLSRPMSLARIIITCFLLSLTPLINYGCFGIELVYLVPATLLGIKMRHTLYDSFWQYYLLLACCLGGQIVIVEYLILHLPIGLSYTISTIIANIITIWIMSLKSYN